MRVLKNICWYFCPNIKTMKLYIKYIIVFLSISWTCFAKTQVCSPNLCSATLNLGSDTAICMFPYTLKSGYPCATHLWSDGSSKDSLIVYKAGTYVVELTDGACSLKDTIVIRGRAAALSKEANVWYFGNSAGLDFNTSPVSTMGNSPIQARSTASICDSVGNLLFYTDGVNVWDKNHNVMTNGTGLLGDPNATQSSIIIPQPSSDSLYIIFTCPSFAGKVNGPTAGFNYSIVDISLNGGLGDVISKNNLLFKPSSEKVAAVRHANGTDVWVMAHESNSKNFRAYLVSATGVSNTAVISALGTTYSSSLHNVGQMKFSPDGTKLLTTAGGVYELYNFDKTTGLLSNLISITKFGTVPYGCEFSPDGTKIYLTDTALAIIRQVDISSGFLSSFINTNIATTGKVKYGLQMGPDGKIYVVDNNKGNTLGIINNPDGLGALSNYQSGQIALPSGSVVQGTLPNFMKDLLTPLKPNFSYTDTCVFSGTQFKLIHFADTVGSSWDFGDGSSASDTIHIYTDKGLKTVKFAYIDGCALSGRDTISKTLKIVGPILKLKDSVSCTLPITLDAQNTGASYTWNTGESSQTISADTVGSYSVSVTLESCTALDTAVIDTVHIANREFSYIDTCFANPTQFHLASLADTSNLSWDFGDNGSSSKAEPSHLFQTKGIQTITLNYIDTCGKTRAHIKHLTILPSDPISLALAKDSICAGETITFTADSIKGGGTLPSLEWRLNGKAQSTNYTFSTSTLQNNDKISVYVTSDAACTQPKEAESNSITIHVIPAPKVTLEPQTLFCEEEKGSIVLDASQANIKTYLWSTGESTANISVNKAGTYSVTITNLQNCTTTSSTEVLNNCEPKVFIPSAFTPNDDGKNDKLEFFTAFTSTFSIKFYNRWGELIYESNDHNATWDGMYLGKTLPSGVYNYVCTYSGTVRGKTETKKIKGDVAILE